MTPNERFWQVAGALVAQGECDEGTMMGNPCLRYGGAFVAMHWEKAAAMIVKLDASSVAAHISDGEGIAFAPNGRVFKEWLAVPDDRHESWSDLLNAALARAKRST